MAKPNCNACDELRQDAPNLIVNGLGDTECASLKNNTGLNPSNGNDNCTDLENLNDCLIGNMEAEIDAYDVCDWKEYMRKFVENTWTVLKGIICAVCGVWAQISSILSRLAKVECFVSTIGKVQNFKVDESNIKWFNGVTRRTDTDPDISDPQITGNAYCGYLTGSIVLPSNFETQFPSSSINTHGILLYEYRVKLSDYNLKRFWPANLQEVANGAGIHAHVTRFTSTSETRPYAAGDTGYADYTVPDGWEYLQVRISSYDDIPSSGKITLAGVIPVLMNPDTIKC